ncbi:SDR family NAD(P)-dependent oxidoreductase [Paradesulfitobacterium ferrireducens]|uniref:SDR family NAD(P)-dependent oxidoreductase n=1 Tax=Paradesulfitobacterium ferrireducens TaxID=2816476 RepID=UPI001A8D5090|nr:SDR family NAD(P)-dependent oxidoreductase [Paradesulfitobacterium ferrireducens]
MANRLNGKIAIVTGAGSGMGKATALEYLRENCKIVAMDNKGERLGALQKEVEEMGLAANLVTFTGSITSNEDCDKAVEAAVKAFGSLNVLTHFAGCMDYFATAEEVTDEDWDYVIAINLTASMRISRACLKYFLPNEIRASMILVTSNGAVQGSTAGVAYIASKGGVESLAQCMAFEYGRNGIRVNTIQPGPFMTAITSDSAWGAKAMANKGAAIHRGTGYNKSSRDWILTGEWVTERYVAADPKHIAGGAVYLASDESAFMNSGTLRIDGGICLG